METSIKVEKAKRRLGGRLRPHFDRMEARLALSGSTLVSNLVNNSTIQVASFSSASNLSIVSISPASSRSLSQSPTSITISFDRPIDPISIDPSGGDFQLVHVGANGQTTPLGFNEPTINEALDPTDPTGSRIALTLSGPLVAGEYRLLLSPYNFLQGLDGSSLSVNFGAATTLTDFTIRPADAGRSSALNLGTIGTTEVVENDVLDLSASPDAVKYYELTLAPGHQWRLGLQIAAESIGSPLTSALSLFDSSGHLISTDNEGVASDPTDPFLFAGLAAGTYYVGVSARNNTPNSSGVYDASGAISNTGVSSNSGGSFQLDLVADLADQPTRVEGLQLNDADPGSTSPTGLTLQFSNSIQMAALAASTQPAVVLLDQNGAEWSLTPINYNAAQGQLSFVFNQPLPAGTYRLVPSVTGGLVDLAGRTPIGQGLNPGVLGSFSLQGGIKVTGDLGAILPDAAVNGLTTSFSIPANSSTFQQFVVVLPGTYTINSVKPPANVSFSLVDPTGHVIPLGVGSSATGGVDAILGTGRYTLLLSNTGSIPVIVPVKLREKEIVFSHLLDNGVAQGSAFSLRLVTPQSNFGAASYGSSSSSTAGTSVPVSSASPVLSQSGGSTSEDHDLGSISNPGFGLIANTSFSASGFILGFAPIGSSSSQSNQISVVGPSGPSGSVALASNSPGIPSGLLGIPTTESSAGSSSPSIAPPIDLEVVTPEGVIREKTHNLAAGILVQAKESQQADERTLAEADWVGRLVSNVFGVFGSTEVSKNPENAAKAEMIPVLREHNGLAAVGEAQIESASLTSPVTIGLMVTTVAYRYRRLFLDRMKTLSKPRSRGPIRIQPILTGPHRQHRAHVRAKVR